MTVDPRARRRVPAVDALAAAVRLEAAAASWQAQQPTVQPTARPDDDPPTAFLDLAAIRAAVAAGGVDPGPVDPAAAAWLAGGPDPGAADVLERVDRLHRAEPEFGVLFVEPEPELEPELEPQPVVELEPQPVVELEPQPVVELEPEPEWPCLQLGNAYHSSGPCGPQHTTAPLPTGPVFRSEHPAGPGWRSRHDERSRAYGLRARLTGAAPLTDRLWPTGPVLDQGADGACVGFGTAGAINATAAGDTDLTATDALAMYHRAQRLDTMPGEAYSGTSVLAGLQAAVQLGHAGGYLWAFGTRDLAQGLLQRGPAVIGIPWLTGLDDPGPTGILTPTGTDRGGHCLAVVGLLLRAPGSDRLGPWFVLQNSYGPGWGADGLGYLHNRDLAGLLHAGGEAAFPTAGPVTA